MTDHIDVIVTEKYPYLITATVRFEDGIGRVIRIEFEQNQAGLPVRRSEIAALPLRVLIRKAADQAGLTGNTPAAERVGSDSSSLEDFIDHYRICRLCEPNPVKVASERFGVSTATARRWLVKAVEIGLLNPEERA